MTHTVDCTTKAYTPRLIKISKSKYLDYCVMTGIKRLKYQLLLILLQNILFNIFSSEKAAF